MSTVIFGHDFDLTTSDQHRFVPQAIEDSNVRIGTLMQMNGLRNMRLDKLLFPKAIEGRDRFVKFVGSLLRMRMGKDGALPRRRDMISLLSTVDDKESGARFTDRELVSECATLVVAGKTYFDNKSNPGRFMAD